MTRKMMRLVMASTFAFAAQTQPAQAATYDLTVKGTDAIYLAGRTDVIVPPLGQPFILKRHDFVGRDFLPETHPRFVPVHGGDTVQISDPVVGAIDFYNGTGNFYGPEGNVGPVSALSALDGISGWRGTEGALAGVFLDDSVPNMGPAPATLDFVTSESRNFASLSPLLRQVFFIGDGSNALGQLQAFKAPAGATRLFIGIPDGFGFQGPPGAYEDNDGSYRIQIGVNERPDGYGLRIPVSPFRTFLRTQGDPAMNALPIDLNAVGLQPGDILHLERTGDFGFNGVDAETGTTMLGLFSTSGVILANTELHRVPGAIEAGIDFVTTLTHKGDLPTDIPEDFLIESSLIRIPSGAKYLFVSAHDEFFSDNVDRNGDFAVRIAKASNPVATALSITGGLVQSRASEVGALHVTPDEGAPAAITIKDAVGLALRFGSAPLDSPGG